MAKCQHCNEEMTTSDGCSVSLVRLNGVVYSRKLYFGVKCHDCGATAGHVHHPMCDGETCPKCETQLISCECDCEYGTITDDEDIIE